MDCGHFADYTPELEKARLWDRIVHFAERGNPEQCDKACPYYSEKHTDECSIFGSCPFCNVVDALSKEAS